MSVLSLESPSSAAFCLFQVFYRKQLRAVCVCVRARVRALFKVVQLLVEDNGDGND